MGGLGGDDTSKFSHAQISAYADNLPVCCTFNHTFQNPSETIPSLSLKNFKKKRKKQKNLKYLDITNQQAPSGLSQRTQWSLPPLTTLLMNGTNSIKKLIVQHWIWKRIWKRFLVSLSCYGDHKGREFFLGPCATGSLS